MEKYYKNAHGCYVAKDTYGVQSIFKWDSEKKSFRYMENPPKLEESQLFCSIETHQCGQARRYGDSVYDYSLTFTRELAKDEVISFVINCIDSHYSEDANLDWWQGTYSLKQNDSMRWRYLHQVPYLD